MFTVIVADSETCTECKDSDIQWNVDYQGEQNRLNDGSNTLTETNQDCCDLCQRNPGRQS